MRTADNFSAGGARRKGVEASSVDKKNRLMRIFKIFF
jgi:hypothetical protein